MAMIRRCRRCATACNREFSLKWRKLGVNGDGALRVPNTSNIYFDHIEGESMVIALDLHGLAVSTGAACSSGAIEPSHVLTSMGLRSDRARASIRFSLGKQSTSEEIDIALALVAGNGGAIAGVVAGIQEGRN